MADKLELTDRKLFHIKPAASGSRYELADTHVGGLRVRVGDGVNESGKAASISFVLLARFPPAIHPTRRTLGTYPRMSLANARKLAIEWKQTIATGADPTISENAAIRSIEAVGGVSEDRSFGSVVAWFLERHVYKQGLRTAKEIESNLRRNAVSHWKDRSIDQVTRRDIAKRLDAVEDSTGSVAADKLLAHLSKLFNWYAARDDEFVSPIVKGMGRSNPRSRARKRILDDDELRAVWAVAEGQGAFGALVQLLLLTGQRRAKVAGMRWDDIDSKGIWSIPTEAREKCNAGSLRLPSQALAIVHSQPKIRRVPLVLSGRGAKPLSGFSKLKPLLDTAVDEKLGRKVPKWTLHDLRRTAKSLMARAGVRPDISERVLGHSIAGVEGIYDRHRYDEEKAQALRQLAGLVDHICADVRKDLKCSLKAAAA